MSKTNIPALKSVNWYLLNISYVYVPVLGIHRQRWSRVGCGRERGSLPSSMLLHSEIKFSLNICYNGNVPVRVQEGN